MVTCRSEHLSSCIFPTATWCWSLLSYRWPLGTRVRCDSGAATAPAESAKPVTSALAHSGVLWGVAKAPALPTSLQLAGSRDAATRAEDGVAKHRWDPSCQRAWNKINVMILPHFPMQRQKKNRFLRSPATTLHFNSTGWFLGPLPQQHRAV